MKRPVLNTVKRQKVYRQPNVLRRAGLAGAAEANLDVFAPEASVPNEGNNSELFLILLVFVADVPSKLSLSFAEPQSLRYTYRFKAGAAGDREGLKERRLYIP